MCIDQLVTCSNTKSHLQHHHFEQENLPQWMIDTRSTMR